MTHARRLVCVAVVIVVTLALARPASAGPYDHPGYAKAVTCSACHGVAGNSRVDTVPILSTASRSSPLVSTNGFCRIKLNG